MPSRPATATSVPTRTGVAPQEFSLTAKDFRGEVKPVWCPGCGDFGVLSATAKALAALQIMPHQVVIVSGIGCSSRLPYFMSTYGVHGVHGRAIPIATGLKMARPDLKVFAMGGDGDLMSIGAGHLPHVCARNVDITCVLMDNQVYGLTKGQGSPTSPMGHQSKSTPYGMIAKAANPILLALVLRRLLRGPRLLGPPQRAGQPHCGGRAAPGILLHPRAQPLHRVLQHV